MIALSNDAKALAGSLWRSTEFAVVSFDTPARITPRAKAALDELVDAGLVMQTVIKRRDGSERWEFMAEGRMPEVAKKVSRTFVAKHGKWPIIDVKVPAYDAR